MHQGADPVRYDKLLPFSGCGGQSVPKKGLHPY